MYKVIISLDSGDRVFTQMGNGQEKNRLISVSEISRALTTDKTFENSTADVTFTNVNNYFDKLLLSTDGFLLGKTLKIYNDGELIFTGKISDFPSCSPEEFKIKADVMKIGLDQPINRVIKKVPLFPAVPDENEGKYSNIVAGVINSDGSEKKGALTAYRVYSNLFMAAWHPLKEITAVYDKSGNPVAFTKENADNRCYIDVQQAGFTDNELYFDCEGMFSGDSLITNPADILKEVNSIVGRINDRALNFNEEDLQKAKDIYNGRGYTGINVAITDSKSWMDFLKDFAMNFDCLTYQKVDGSIGVKVLQWGGEVPRDTINSVYVDRESFEQWMDVSGIVNEYRRNYVYSYGDKKYLKTPQDVEAGTNWGEAVADIDMMYHTDDASCLDVVVRRLFFQKKPLVWYRFRIHKSKGDEYELADVIRTKFWNSYYDDQWRLVQIYRKSYSHDTDMITFEGLDITGVNKGSFILYADDDPNIVRLNDENKLDDPTCEVLL